MLRIFALLTCLFSPTCALAQWYTPDPYDPYHYDPYVPRRPYNPPLPFYGHEGVNPYRWYGPPRRDYYGPREPGYPRGIPTPHNYRYYPGDY